MEFFGPDYRPRSDLAFFLRSRREARAIKAAELAKFLAVDLRTVLEFERNAVVIPLKMLESIAQYLEISPGELVIRAHQLPSEVTGSSTNADEARVRLFRDFAMRVADLAAKAGVQVEPFENPALPHFQKLMPSLQDQALASLRLKSEILETWLAGGEASSPNQILWATLSGLGLVPPPELFQHLKPSSIIEIFNLSYFQIWRDFNTLRVNSFTLEEMYCLSGFERFERAPEIDAYILEWSAKLSVAGRGDRVLMLKLPPYPLVEKNSRKLLTLEVEHELVCALRDRDGNMAAWLLMTNARVTGNLS
jgi:transcriptional regulator with XRE-family HTH domain